MWRLYPTGVEFANTDRHGGKNLTPSRKDAKNEKRKDRRLNNCYSGILCVIAAWREILPTSATAAANRSSHDPRITT